MRKALAYIVALTLASPAMAQQADSTMLAVSDTLAVQLDTLAAPADSLAVPVDSSSVLIDYSILGLKMQRRFRPVNQPFNENKRFSSNSFVSIIGSGYQQFAENYSNGPYLTVGWGKWFSQWHGMKLALGGGYYMDNYVPQRVVQADLRASYMFNLTGFVDGYRADRTVEWYPLAGLGYTMTLVDGKATWGPSAHIGLDLNMRLFPGMDLVLEPLLEMQSDSRRLPRMDADVWRGYLFALHTGVGVRFFMDEALIGGDPGKDWFYTLSGGFQRQGSEMARNISFGRSIGAAAMFGAGRYYGDSFACRLQTGFSWHYWKEIKEGDTDIYGKLLEPGKFPSMYFVGRLDLMAETLGIFLGKRLPEGFPLGVWAMAGPEIGVLYKIDPYYTDIVYPYVGVSGGLQVKYRLWKGMSIFLEPRISRVPYSAHSFTRTDTEDQNYYDYVMSVSLGVEGRLGSSYWKKKSE